MSENNTHRRWNLIGGTGCGCLLVLAACLALVVFAIWNPFGWFQKTETTSAPAPSLQTGCTYWDPSKETQYLLPGYSARGDVKANGQIFYDNGSGEGTTIVNLSSKPVEIFAEWGSGCETSVDVKFLVSKDLTVGCGDTTGDGVGDGCSVARVVVFEDGKDPVQTYYVEPVE